MSTKLKHFLEITFEAALQGVVIAVLVIAALKIYGVI